jgi:hypothetical protein
MWRHDLFFATAAHCPLLTKEGSYLANPLFFKEWSYLSNSPSHEEGGASRTPLLFKEGVTGG